MNSAPPCRVLIVDDDQPTRDGLAMVLHAIGHEVETAQNGKEALEMLAQVRPDVIMLDLSMPVMDGWTFRLQQLLDPRVADIPVIVLSGSDAQMQDELRLLGIRDYIPKPGNGDDTLTMVGTLFDAMDRIIAVPA